MAVSKAFATVPFLVFLISYANACDNKDLKSDVVFLLDSSSSIYDSDFKLTLNFVKDFADSVTVSPNDVRIAVVLFAFGASVEFDLNTYNTSDQVKAAVDGIQRTYGGTFTYMGLLEIQNDIFGSSSFSRRDVKQSVILITDGRSNNQIATRTAAQTLKDDGIEIITIGIGGDVDWTELTNIATSRLHNIFLNDFGMLPTTQDEVLEIICLGCSVSDVKADIVFLLDSSSSISDTNFNISLQFVKNVTDSVKIGTHFVRVAVFTYSFITSMEFDLKAYNTSKEVDQALDKIQRTYGGTTTHSALEKVRRNSGLDYGNARPDVNHLLVLITDGYSDNKGATIIEARRLREDGVEIAVIGITTEIDRDELLHVASSPDHLFYIKDFYMLPSLSIKFLNILCKRYSLSSSTTAPTGTTSDSIILGPPGIVG